MAKWGRESGSCTGRGFSEVDANGYLAKFEAWVVKTAVNHGPQWNIVEDQTSLTPLTCNSATDVNTTTEEITITGHGLAHQRAVRYTAGTVAIGGLTTNTVYYVIRVSANVIKLATTEANAYSGTAINLSSTGTGTQTFTPEDPFIVCCDIAAPTLNAYNTGTSGGAPKFIKAGYPTTVAGEVRFNALMWWDSTLHQGQGIFGGARIGTYDAATFSYFFAGGDEGMGLFSRLGTSWDWCILDEFESIGTSFLEGSDKVGVLQTGITAGSSVVCQLGTGQAANFTVNKYYYIYDFDQHTWVNYAKVTARDIVADTVTLDTVGQNFPANSVLCAYAHRFAFASEGDTVMMNCNYQGSSYWALPYVSAYGANAYVVHNQVGYVYGLASIMDITSALSCYNRSSAVSEDNDWLHYKHCLLEYSRHNDNNFTGMNRIYGKTKNVLKTTRGTMAQMLDTRTFNSVEFINHLYSTTYTDMFRYGESTT